MLNVRIVICAKCHIEALYAECQYAARRYAECHGAMSPH
jgi:hypothetical protein